jgi:transcriptional regulator with XRE-family HTH domain
MSLKAFGDFISQKIAERRIKRKELAEMLGVRQNTISGWITGSHRPEDKYIAPLADAIKVPQWELLSILSGAQEENKLEEIAEVAATKYGRKKLKMLMAQLSLAGFDLKIKGDVNPQLIPVEQIEQLEKAFSELLKIQLDLSNATVENDAPYKSANVNRANPRNTQEAIVSTT